jgi:hypothetical protein
MLGPQTLDTTRDYLLTLSHPDEQQDLLGVFTGDEVMEGVIWAGEDQASAASFSAGWAGSIDGNPDAIGNPVVGMTVTAGAISSLSPGIYEFRVTIPATDTEIYRGQIDLRAGPGTATAPAVYASRKDLLDLVPWMEQLQGSSDMAGFVEQRALARSWLEDVIHAHAPRGFAGDQLVAPLGSAWLGRGQWLADELAADHLVVTNQIKRCVSYYAAGLVLMREPGTRGEREYREIGATYLLAAESIAHTITVEIDTDADGVGDVAIDLSNVQVIRG